jgi:hypothetical protein
MGVSDRLAAAAFRRQARPAEESIRARRQSPDGTGLGAASSSCLSGNDKEAAASTWNNLRGRFADLAAAGFEKPVDRHGAVPSPCRRHVGWNDARRWEWVPTSAGAYRWAGSVAHWRRRGATTWRRSSPIRSRRSTMPGSPTGRDHHRICDELRLVPTIGHTPGHVSVAIASEGEEALITGDFMHHPCQIARPDWSSTADSDPDEARRTRRHMLGELCDRPVLVIGTHFAGATAGHIVRDGDTYRLAV